MQAIDVAYAKNVAFHGDAFRAQGANTEVLWRGGPQSQRDRFVQIVRMLPDLTDSSVLDVGCGFGDLYDFLTESGFERIRYTGLDLCAEMVEESRRRHPDAEFLQTGVLEWEAAPGSHDFVVGSGIFAMPTPEWESYVVTTLKRMLEISRVGVVVNFLSSYSRSPSPESHYASPAETLRMVMDEVTPWADLTHNYRWNDFTVALFREPQSR